MLRCSSLRHVGAALAAVAVCTCAFTALARDHERDQLAATSPAPPLPGDATAIDIQWDSPPECPDAAHVRRATERLLGQPLATPRSQHIVARARVRKNDAQNYELELMLGANQRVAEETLVAKHCSALADATALKVALATDPLAVVAAIAPPIARAQVPETASELRAERTAARAPGARDGSQLGLRLQAGAGFGPLPTAAPGGGIVASLQWPIFRAELGAQAFGGSDVRYSNLREVGAHLQLWSGMVRACATPKAGILQFPVCLGVELGVMRGRGFGVSDTEASSSAWGALIVGPAVRVPLGGRFSLWVEADAIVPVLRPGFHVRNLDTLYVAPTGASRGWAGVEMVVP